MSCLRALAFLLIGAMPACLALDAQQIDQRAPAVLRVEADDCQSASREATGFEWEGPTTVVTAWHVVSGCEAIQVYSQADRASYDAQVERVLVSRDLALLRLSRPLMRGYPLHAAAAAPGITDELTVLGYPENIQTLRSTTFHAAYGARDLGDAVPDAVASDLQRSGFLRLDTTILNIDGHLLPGHSGAPILDSSGDLVAIADGGLASGTVGISWALPVSYLADLVVSADRPSTLQSARSADLFAYDIQAQHPPAGPVVNCGGYQFQLVRQIGYGELLPSTDDPLGMQQILGAIGPQVMGLRFDIYQEAASGASFALPLGAVPQSGPDACRVSSNSGRVWFLIAMAPYASPQELESRAQRYEAYAMSYPPWQYDPAMSYAMPVNRFDGFGVRRKSFFHFAPMPPTGQMLPDARTFETLATRHGTLLTVSTLNRQWSPYIVPQGVQACSVAPASDPCVRYLEWASAVISVQLATFPIG